MRRLVRTTMLSCIACASSCSGSQASVPADGASTRTPPIIVRPADPTKPQPIDPGIETPQVRFVGRFDLTEPEAPKAAWPGSRIVARFEGTKVSVMLREHAAEWMTGRPSHWDVSIDGLPPRVLVMTDDDAAHAFTLADDLLAGPHTIELYKRTEAQNGITEFLGFDFHGGRPLAPPSRASRHIEVIGDSASSGLGVEALDLPNLDCEGAAHQNFRKTWGARLGTMFDAEVHAITYSGKGVLRNTWLSDGDSLISYYGRSNPDPTLFAAPPMFDMATWVPDVIVLMMGAADFAPGITDDGRTVPSAMTEEIFRQGYRAFVVGQLRRRGPNVHLFLVVPDGARDVLARVTQTVASERHAVGDDKVHAYTPSAARPGEMNGCNGHPNPTYHQRIAAELGEQIRDYVGWE